MIDINEMEIIKGLKLKDEHMIKEFMNIYKDRLMKVAYMVMKDINIAEEIVQETFIKIIKDIDKFEGKSSLYTYVYKIAINQCRQKLRKNWFKRITLVDKWFEGGDYRDWTEKSIDKLTIDKSIGKLKFKYREVLLLYYYEDMSIEKIAEVTGDKKGTIKSKLSRARSMLKDILSKEGFNE
ncbi:RNA polymerase sigma factor [Dethiothermospora halolimnae]|uniref:RNA polymerase sigma factor n=1 Tax=Dethiothermospora halolimnae TaxID=3114390 RepID=UPI003CCB7904